jgi:hypothetical protein
MKQLFEEDNSEIQALKYVTIRVLGGLIIVLLLIYLIYAR